MPAVAFKVLSFKYQTPTPWLADQCRVIAKRNICLNSFWSENRNKTVLCQPQHLQWMDVAISHHDTSPRLEIFNYNLVKYNYKLLHTVVVSATCYLVTLIAVERNHYCKFTWLVISTLEWYRSSLVNILIKMTEDKDHSRVIFEEIISHQAHFKLFAGKCSYIFISIRKALAC